jgi:uncharacterized phosphosugar-binding protein
MSAAQIYLQKIREMLCRLEETQMTAITRAGTLCADALIAGHQVYVNPRGTHSIHTELTHRAGGFISVMILSEDAAELNAGDVVITGTNAGFDPSTVGLALRCRALGVKTIAITTVVFEQSISSVDPSGKTLHEVADVCIDQGGVCGDAVLEFPELVLPIIPSSGAMSVITAWMIFAAAAERMIAAGKPPLVYQAVQLQGAADRNARNQTEAARTGLSYYRRVRACLVAFVSWVLSAPSDARLAAPDRCPRPTQPRRMPPA